jgi:uncharacterized sulfatase
MKPVRITCLLLGLGMMAVSAKAQPLEERPNFLIIMADDLGYGDLSSYGATLIDTPHIDRLAEEGMKMTSYYAGEAVCTPSRAALLTGRYAVRSGAQFVFHPPNERGMDPDEVTIAEMLGAAGYATGMVGKWHLGHRLEYWPTSQGFDEFYGVAYSNDMVPFDLYQGTELVEKDIDQRTLTGKYADAVVEFLEEHRDEPFLLYYAENFPHIPLYHPEESRGRSEAGEYGDVVETMDDAVGRILGALDRLGLAENTVVFFTSDNGPWFEGSSGPVRGRKGGVYQGGYKVPMLVRWPGHIPAGAETNEMAMGIDILPTLADLARAEVPGDRIIDGKSLAGMLTEEAKSPHDYLYFFDGNDVAAVRSRTHRLVLRDYYKSYALDFEDENLPPQFEPLLFDLTRDQSESYDVAEREPRQYRRLLERAHAMAEETADLKVIPEPMMGEEGAHRGPLLTPREQ